MDASLSRLRIEWGLEEVERGETPVLRNRRSGHTCCSSNECPHTLIATVACVFWPSGMAGALWWSIPCGGRQAGFTREY